MEKEYDLIVIGGGLNGLLCSAYLAKCGAKVLLIEKRHETGGALITEDFAGFRYNLHATYHMMANVMPATTDFNLGQHGVIPIIPDAQVAIHLPDNQCIVFYQDIEKTSKSLEKYSPTDAQHYKTMMTEFQTLCHEILIPATYTLPIPPIEHLVMMNQTDYGKRLAHLSEMSPIEILDHYQIKHPGLRAALLFLSIMWGIPHNTGGLGFMVPIYLYRMTQMALLKGGSHRLSSALARIFIKLGGSILDGEEVKHISIENKNAKGVITDSGMVFKARSIVSTLNPEQTFINMIGENHLPIELYQQAKKWKWEHRSLYGLHLSLHHAPIFKSEITTPDSQNALLHILGYETEAKIIDHLNQLQQGQLPTAAGHATITTFFDGSQAPKGNHTGRWECFAPYELDWDAIKNSYADQCIQTWNSYLKEPLSIIRSYPYTPHDIERKLSTMKKGSIKHGDYNPLQMGFFRPNDLCSSIKTPIQGLYVCGASVYPGGMILGGPGYIAANVIAKDLNYTPCWHEPEMITQSRKKGYIR